MTVFNSYIQAFQQLGFYLSNGSIWKFIIPSVVVTVFYGLLFLMFSFILAPLNLLSFLPWVGDFIQNTYDWLWNSSLSVVFYAQSFTVLTLLSPFMSMLSSKCDEMTTGFVDEYSTARLISDLWRAVKLNIRLFVLYLIAAAVILWLIQPLLGETIAKGLSYLLSSYLFGFSLFDYNFERYQMNISTTFKKGNSNWIVLLIGGTLFQFIYVLPIIGTLFAPFLVTIITTHVFITSKASWGLTD